MQRRCRVDNRGKALLRQSQGDPLLPPKDIATIFPGFPVMPGSLMIEGMAQTGGILLGEHYKFEYNVILAKVPKVTFHSWACPGDQLIYTADLQDAREEGGSVTVNAKVGERLVAEANELGGKDNITAVVIEVKA